MQDPDAVDQLQLVTRQLLALALDSLRSADGLALTHMRLLFAVHDHGDSSCAELAEHLGISASSVTHQADRLVASGHLARGADPNNRSIVSHNFAPAAPDRLWVADITYVSTWLEVLRLDGHRQLQVIRSVEDVPALVDRKGALDVADDPVDGLHDAFGVPL